MIAKKWLSSLLFPIIILSGYIILMIKVADFGGFKFADFLFCHLAMLISAITPLFLTVKHKIDLSQYFLSRSILFIIGTVLGVVSIAGIFVGLFWLLVVPLLVHTVYYSRKEVETLEKAILLLTNPSIMFLGVLIDFLRGWASTPFHL